MTDQELLEALRRRAQEPTLSLTERNLLTEAAARVENLIAVTGSLVSIFREAHEGDGDARTIAAEAYGALEALDATDQLDDEDAACA
jgi:hypothetical protein